MQFTTIHVNALSIAILLIVAATVALVLGHECTAV